MAPQEWRLPGTRPTELEVTVDTIRITPAGDPFHAAPHDHNERPHACTDGVVYIGHLAEDPGTGEGEEVEVIEAVPCRRCADSR
jgi:hypothetical protein